MGQLDGKVAVITGGARGIGAGIATVMAQQGANIAILDLDAEGAAITAAGLGTPAIGLRADAIDEADFARAMKAVAERFGGIDIIANNAGAGRIPLDPAITPIGRTGRVEALESDAWDEQLAQNLRSTFLGTKVGLPYLKERGGGSIVNIASIAGISASPGLPAYAAAKAGVISLSRTNALEYAPLNIRVNAICPGYLWTRAWEGLATGMKRSVPAYADREPRDIFLEVVKNGVPLRREQTPEDIGHLAAFLCSPAAWNITGQVISVDGGITLR